MNMRNVLATLLLPALLLCAVSADAAQLVTPEEARLPAGMPRPLLRSVPAGPKIVVVDPGADKDIASPLRIEVRFVALADAAVDVGTLKVIYVKLFDIDITDRVKPYASVNGILLEDADLPAGSHTIEIELKDSKGRETVERLEFTVARK